MRQVCVCVLTYSKAASERPRMRTVPVYYVIHRESKKQDTPNFIFYHNMKNENGFSNSFTVRLCNTRYRWPIANLSRHPLRRTTSLQSILMIENELLNAHKSFFSVQAVIGMLLPVYQYVSPFFHQHIWALFCPFLYRKPGTPNFENDIIFSIDSSYELNSLY